MNFLRKLSCVCIISLIAIINIKIIINYKIIKPTQKYTITLNTKTAAKVLDLSNSNPEQSIELPKEEEKKKTTTTSSEKKSSTETEVKKQEKTTNQTTSKTENTTTTAKKETAAEEIKKEEKIETKTESETISTPENENKSTSEPEKSSEPETKTANGSDIVSTAKSYLGYNYVSGGSSPSTGFDCSGFTKYVYKQYGIDLNRTAADQAKNGTPISKSELQPGDLVLFSYYGSDSIGHAGIYIGNGEMIHAANSKRGVVKDTINSGYYSENYVTARRVK